MTSNTMLSRDEAEAIAAKINDAEATDDFGCRIVAHVWQAPRSSDEDPRCRVYLRTDSRSQRQLGYVDALGYTGKARKRVRRVLDD